MADNFQSNAVGLTSPCSNHYLIDPSDTVDLPFVPRTILILTDGNIVLRDKGGDDLSYPVTAGQHLDFRAVRCLLTGTTATAVAWY